MCEGKDPWISSHPCFRLQPNRYAYGVPSPEHGCPCERNKLIEKAACGLIAFKDCLTNTPNKKRLNFSIFLGIYRGIYTPVRLTLYPFHLEITLHKPHWIVIKIGKLCRFCRFRFKLIDWTTLLRGMK